MHISENYRDGLTIIGDFQTNAWVRRSVGGSYVIQCGAGELQVLNAHNLVEIGEALVKYGKARHRADFLNGPMLTAGTTGA